jgi:hypothetical protein
MSGIPKDKIIELLKNCIIIKNDFDKYCSFDYEFEGDITITRDTKRYYSHNGKLNGSKSKVSPYMFDYKISNCKNISGSDLNNCTFEIGEYTYIISNGIIDNFEYIKRLNKLFGINEIGVKLPDHLLSYKMSDYYIQIRRNCITVSDVSNNLLFIYNCKNDTIINKKINENVEFIEIGNDYTELNINAFGKIITVYFYAIEDIIDNKCNDIRIEFNDNEVFKVYEINFSKNDPANSIQNYNLKTIVTRMKDEIDKFSFLIEALQKISIDDGNVIEISNNNKFDGMAYNTNCGIKIPMTLETFNQVKELDEDTVIKLFQSFTDNNLEDGDTKLSSCPIKKVRKY